MNKQTIFLFLTFFITSFAFAQHKTLILNYEKSSFGENEPLPSNQHFIISGVVTPNIPYVEVSILTDKGKEDRDPIYTTFWKRETNNNTGKFIVPINTDLREGKNYDVYVRYYELVKGQEKDELEKLLQGTLSSYVDGAVTVSGNKLSVEKSQRQVLSDLNEIVIGGLSQYRSRVSFQFSSFSDIVKLKLKQLDGAKIDKPAKDEKRASVASYEAVKSFKQMLYTELKQYLNVDIHVMIDDKLINDYPTEKVQNYLPINIGYGGAVMNGDFDNFNYGAAPYIGLSFPFGKEGSDSKFWSKTSLSVGAFLSNLEDINGTEYSGPIFKIPPYAALGYRAFRFIRINAGAAFLNNTTTSEVSIVPFVGVSAEFNLSVSIAK